MNGRSGRVVLSKIPKACSSVARLPMPTPSHNRFQPLQGALRSPRTQSSRASGYGPTLARHVRPSNMPSSMNSEFASRDTQGATLGGRRGRVYPTREALRDWSEGLDSAQSPAEVRTTLREWVHSRCPDVFLAQDSDEEGFLTVGHGPNRSRRGSVRRPQRSACALARLPVPSRAGRASVDCDPTRDCRSRQR